jgi:hypothetical protein
MIRNLSPFSVSVDENLWSWIQGFDLRTDEGYWMVELADELIQKLEMPL